MSQSNHGHNRSGTHVHSGGSSHQAGPAAEYDQNSVSPGGGNPAGGTPPRPRPVLAICGFSGSGKTTLIERVLPRLCERGLAVAVVKHDVHGLDVDRPGKDSDRLFRAGADVLLRGPDEVLHRAHERGHSSLDSTVGALLSHHDLVLVEGHKSTSLPKLWLTDRQDAPPPASVENVIKVLSWGSDRESVLLAAITEVMKHALRLGPVHGGILIGGSGTRMGGRRKHVLTVAGRSLLETVHRILEPNVDDVVLLGSGPRPSPWDLLPCLPDPPSLGGPMAGMLAALRWRPAATWLFVGCDMPRLSADAIAWLLGQRGPGRWAVLPRVSPAGVEPLLAVYEHQARLLLEDLALGGCLKPRNILKHPRVVCPEVPDHLHDAWVNVNTPEDLKRI